MCRSLVDSVDAKVFALIAGAVASARVPLRIPHLRLVLMPTPWVVVAAVATELVITAAVATNPAKCPRMRMRWICKQLLRLAVVAVEATELASSAAVTKHPA